MEPSPHDSPEAIIILDIENNIIGVNPAGEKLLGTNRADLIGKSVEVVFPRQSSKSFRNKILKDGRKEANLCRNNGQTFYVELTISTINGLNGEQIGRVVLIRDGTQAQQNETRLEQNQSVKSQNLMLRALQETTFDLHSSLDLNVVLKNIVERACKLLGTSHGYLDLLEEDADELIPVVGIGALEEALGYKVVRGEGVAGTVWLTGEPIVIDDYDQWNGRSKGFSYGAIRSIIGMPLKLNEKVVGVFGVAHSFNSKIVFSNDDVLILRRFADLAAVALQDARLFLKAQAEIEFRRKTEIELRNANQLLQFQIERIKLLQAQLRDLAVRDSLTNLYNRRYLHEMLEVEFARSTRAETSLAILMLDSDHLKDINDKFGHKAGDDFLVHIATVIRESIRAGDIACRYGGDEFVVVLSDVTDTIAKERAENLREGIASHHIVHRNEKIGISVSIGIAMFPAHGSSGEVLLQKADQSLYEAKRMGKNRVFMFNEDLK